MLQRSTLLGLFGLFCFFISAQSSDWNWSPAGPIYTAGRARNLLVDKKDPKGATLYVGSSSSGIFRTTDEGRRWYPLDDQGSIKNISYMAQASDGTIYVATGEGFLHLTQKERAQPGTGLYKLVNDQLVPVASSANVGTVITRIACHPSLNTIALASDKGILISSNGSPFQLAADIPTDAAIHGMDVKFDASGLLYCTVGNETGALLNGINSATVASKVYKSADASLSHFTEITPNAPFLPQSHCGRIELAIAPSNNNIVYAACANKNTSTPANLTFHTPSLKALFVTYNAQDAQPSWVLVQQFSAPLDPAFNGSDIASGDYALSLAVEPGNPEKLYIGSYSMYIYKRSSGSQNLPLGEWTRTGQNSFYPHQSYLHENIHDIVIIPGSPRKFYFVTDAGIYRSLDYDNTSPTVQPSFQAFYKGLSTGQFNSVSIERYPLADNTHAIEDGSTVKPYSGFIGGTNGNGFVYYSGKDTVVSLERSYAPEVIYNSEFSKIAPSACFMSSATGLLLRSTDPRVTAPSLPQLAIHTGSLSAMTNTIETFSNEGFSAGTPFRLWENYGQRKASPDSVIFYNDSVQAVAQAMSYDELIKQRKFSFSVQRPGKNHAALIDSIVVRTGTIVLADFTPSAISIPFITGQDISIALPDNYSTPTNTTTLSDSSLSIKGPFDSGAPPVIKLNKSSLVDEISVTFATAPFANKTQTSTTVNYAGYYRVFATVFYKYKAGDTIKIVDNSSISTKTFSYQTVLKKALQWDYSALPVYTVSAQVQSSIPNPTFILVPGNIVQTSPVFTLQPRVKSNYTITQIGSLSSTDTPLSFTISAKPINAYTIAAVIPASVSPLPHVLSVVPNAAISGSTYSIAPASGVLSATQGSSPGFTVAPAVPTNYTITQSGTGSPSFSSTVFNATGGYSFVLEPGTISQSNRTFSVSPSATTLYTITQLGSTAPSPPVTYSSIGSTTYILNPGAIQQSTPAFVVTPTITTTYTLQTISSNTVSAASSSTVITLLSARTVSTGVGSGTDVPMSAGNVYIKIGTQKSARLALVMNNGLTNFKTAIVLSKNALALNDPMEVIRISQSGCYSDDASGNPSTASITIPGKPTVLEWSKSGTELYFATDSNKLYRVSHITDIFDMSSSSYNGKFLSSLYTFPDNKLNPNSPYRTTLIGSFDKPVTSISVSNDDQRLAITFHPNSSSAGNVLYNSSDARSSNVNNIGWVDKGGALSNSISAIYCSLMEKDDSRRVFIGTDRGVFYTSDINSGTWDNVNSKASSGKLPYIQVFDIEQQTMDAWDCYNSGQIYAATNGRGIWTNRIFFSPYTVGIEEQENTSVQNTALHIFPNPAREQVSIVFEGLEGEPAFLTVMDMTGRMVMRKDLGRLNSGEVRYDLDINSLGAGLYLLSVDGETKVKGVAKLIVTR